MDLSKLFTGFHTLYREAHPAATAGACQKNCNAEWKTMKEVLMNKQQQKSENEKQFNKMYTERVMVLREKRDTRKGTLLALFNKAKPSSASSTSVSSGQSYISIQC